MNDMELSNRITASEALSIIGDTQDARDKKCLTRIYNNIRESAEVGLSYVTEQSLSDAVAKQLLDDGYIIVEVDFSSYFKIIWHNK